MPELADQRQRRHVVRRPLRPAPMKAAVCGVRPGQAARGHGGRRRGARLAQPAHVHERHRPRVLRAVQHHRVHRARPARGVRAHGHVARGRVRRDQHVQARLGRPARARGAGCSPRRAPWRAAPRRLARWRPAWTPGAGYPPRGETGPCRYLQPVPRGPCSSSCNSCAILGPLAVPAAPPAHDRPSRTGW